MKVKPLLQYAFRRKSASLWRQELQELQEFRSTGVLEYPTGKHMKI
jgi:hypothetical protein